MFLKRIEMQGFKSFADKVVIQFNQPVTGIVGPNGCGKSNITDAVRWVLGEQSVKSMRSSSMTDVIFTGSFDRRKVNVAEVTLVFDNSNKALNSEYNEVEITRRIHRDTHEGEYFINKVPCRLKDIYDIVTDSGLGRDSLSMISQGSISHFAEAKPADRRLIFEEAAGVAKYKKRKTESISKLERTQENMNRVQDIVVELERQVTPLKRAAKKAMLYKEKKEQLQKIETAVLVAEIEKLDTEIQQATQIQFDVSTQITMSETSIQVQETANQENKQLVRELDLSIHQLQEEMMRVVAEIQTLETRKIEVDEKRKYAMEVGDKQQRAHEISALLQQAQQEYEDRLARLSKSNADIELYTQQSIALNRQLIDRQMEVDSWQTKLRKLTSREEILNHMMQRPFVSQAGVSAILSAKHSLKGIHDVMANLFSVSDGYEEALSVALGGAQFNIVTDDEAAARAAIGFLKRNQSGRATFMPLTVVKPRTLHNDVIVVASHTEGYLGTADMFVTNHPAYDDLAKSMLGNVLVVKHLEAGNELASRTRYQYKIVTLEGDVIHRGGTMSGGKGKDHVSLLTVGKELEDIKEAIAATSMQLKQRESLMSMDRNKKAETDQLLLECRLSTAQLEPVVEAKRAKYERLKNDLETLNPEGVEQNGSLQDSLIDALNKSYSRRDEITTSIRLKRDQRMKLSNEVERKEIQLRQMRRELSALSTQIHQIQLDQTRMETRLENVLQRLASEYQMTYEYAKTLGSVENIEEAQSSVASLRAEIDSLGNINMNAPEEYSEINDRYEFLSKQLDELAKSRDQLLKIITDMDKIMVEQFSEMFKKINGELQDVFVALFGGGKCKLVLEDPDDLLNTGVDIDVQPPGKTVQNIRLFSGGEKSLIAISVLFAIIKARHVPLCIFDEVEAALDQGNVERFARYLKRFSETTQFIVVTHRPGTMAQCDVLYGVTMPNHGVSQMLRVKLADAVSMIEEGDEQHGISATA